MKIEDINICLTALESIKAVSDRQTYNLSTAFNKEIIKIRPLLEKEKERMETDKVIINCPAIMLIASNEVDFNKTTLSDFINKKLQELVMNDYKIIDYGMCDIEGVIAFIKYTS